MKSHITRQQFIDGLHERIVAAFRDGLDKEMTMGDYGRLIGVQQVYGAEFDLPFSRKRTKTGVDALTAQRDLLNDRLDELGGRSEGRATWQPIETAPKLKTVIVCWDYERHSDMLYQCEDGSWSDGDSDDYQTPTHWMPLPDPPSASGEDQ